MKDYYSIGELGRLFDLNVQTLYYYDSIGLLTPSKRNPENGRRYYAIEKVYQLSTIRFLRRLGYSVEQIKEYLSTSDMTRSLESLRERSRQMKAQWEELIATDQIIQRKLLFIEQKLQGIDTATTVVRQLPERRYLPIGDEEIVYYHDSYYFYPIIVFYHGTERRFAAYLGPTDAALDEENSKIDPAETQTIPAGQFLCGYHVGPYENVAASVKRIRESHPELELAEDFIDMNIIDQFIECDPEKYITEIQIPVIARGEAG